MTYANRLTRMLSLRLPLQGIVTLLVLALCTQGALASPFVSGLAGGTGSTVGPGGDLFVVEPLAGRIARIDPRSGNITTFASGLPLQLPWVGLGGAMDIAFIGQQAYVLVTLVGPDVGGTDTVGVYRVDGPNQFSVIADIGEFTINNPSDTIWFVPSGVQYAMEAFRGGLLVTDGHHNRVLWIKLDGQISELRAFDNIVPTGLAIAGNSIYMAEAGPVPHLPEDGRVIAFSPRSADTTAVASGASLLVDVEFGRGQTLYALSQGQWNGAGEGSPAADDTGALVRVNGDGSVSLIADGLDRPTSLEFVGTSAYIVTLDGEVLRIDGVGAPPFGKRR